ncbi:hypothetical protein KY331_04290 [Candidatus Woesearchaeota archaeon]|nr:hypothetical protein [Candidatus Woesearchaeota archaeon]
MNVINDVNIIKMIQQAKLNGQNEVKVGNTIIRFPKSAIGALLVGE